MAIPLPELGIDGNGNSESKLADFDFSTGLAVGDVLTGSPAPVFTQLIEDVAVQTPLLTFGTPSIVNGNFHVQSRMSLVGGAQGTVYSICCTAHTVGGDLLMCFGKLQTIGL